MSLEKIYTSTSRFLINCINTCISIFKIVIDSKFKIVFPEVGQASCIVLGNGPSLNQSFEKYPESFKKHALVCVNGFSLSDSYVDLKPKYYVILDPGFWSDNNEGIKKMIEALIERTSWELYLFVPSKARKTEQVKQIKSRNPKIKIVCFNYTVFKGFESIAYPLYKKNLAMPQSQNILVAALFVSINLHFKNIYIVGADHTWHENLHLDPQNRVCVKIFHFYDTAAEVTYQPFYRDAHRIETFKMHEVFTALSKSFYGYESVRKYAAYCKTEIYNSSEYTFVDAFERREIE